MEDLKNSLKTVLTRKVIDFTEEGRTCFGCDDPDFPHTCNSSFIEKLENNFNTVWYCYATRNSFQIKEKLYRAILIDLLADHMPRAAAVEKADDMAYYKWVKDGGGSMKVSSTTSGVL